ncbi:MAG: ATP synthase F1 subunit gamma [Rikenellaceae bacterium]|jgi:F-type H+-transporting ATPase subunit gamma|nr:ATP synthase F1 subunit gamma [Rikenellaceae bacterium]
MASLKEIKERIKSIDSTRKITNAMRMVSSSKLHKAQRRLQAVLQYDRALAAMLDDLLSEDAVVGPFGELRRTARVAIVAISSNSSLCGAFNANVIKELKTQVENYEAQLGSENILLFPVGNKVADAVRRMGYEARGEYRQLIDKPDFASAAALMGRLKGMFLAGEVDRVITVSQHMRSMAVQEVVVETVLPVSPLSGRSGGRQRDFIVEPDRATLYDRLTDHALDQRLYTRLADSSVAEHAARVVAMQIAGDNADKLLGELRLTYNKSRQMAITSQLLDIFSGQR